MMYFINKNDYSNTITIFTILEYGQDLIFLLLIKMSNEFYRKRVKYEAQCDILHIDNPRDVNGVVDRIGYGLKYVIINSTNEQQKALVIRLNNKTLLDDFEYLEIFVDFTVLILGQEHLTSIAGNYDIGSKLYCSLPRLNSLIINHNVKSLHKDFALLTPFLKILYFRESLTLSDVVYDFPCLKELEVGTNIKPSNTDMKWIPKAPLLEFLILKNIVSPIPCWFPNLINLQVHNCDLRHILFTDWTMLTKIQDIMLYNCYGIPTFSTWVPQLTTLKTLNLSNQQFSPNNVDFSEQIITINSSLRALEYLLLYHAKTTNVVLDASGTEGFALRKIDITNNDLRNVNTTNLKIVNNWRMPGGHMAIDLVYVDISGEYFPWALFSMKNLEVYTGGFKIDMSEYQSTYEYTLKNEHYNIAWWLVEIIEYNEIVKSQLYNNLHNANPQLKFIQNEKKIIASIPFFVLYDPSTTTDNPFDGSTICPICLDTFLKDNHDAATIITNEFMEMNIASHNQSVVRCNITKHDIIEKYRTKKIEIRNKNGTIKNEYVDVVQKEIKNHESHYCHLSCYELWILEKKSVKSCMVNRDIFYNHYHA